MDGGPIARSEPLFVAGSSRTVMNTNRCRRVRFDHLLELDAGGMRRRSRHDFVEARLQSTGVAFSVASDNSGRRAAILQASPSKCRQVRADDAVAAVDRVLHVANEMGEADLIFLFGPSNWPA